MTVIVNNKPILKLTQAAIKQLTHLMESKHKEMPDSLLRIFAAKGCAGIQYGFSFVDEKTAEDTSIQAISVSDNAPVSISMLTDKDSALLIDGATIDFSNEDTTGPRFIVNNPNDKGGGCAGCSGGCGA